MGNVKKFSIPKLILIILVVLLLLVFLVAFPIISVSVYDSIFKVRIQTPEKDMFTVDRYPGLTVENCSFTTKQGHTLAGYRYQTENLTAPRGVVVLAHGFGGGGHVGYMPLINYFTSNGYYVFSYDATANDNSEGEYVGGFPQGVIDLDYALQYVKADSIYQNLPIFLIGHSWGGYSVGNVLNFHPDVAGAVMLAGFDESKLLIRQTGLNYVGGLVDLMVPYVQIYEWIKFGSHAGTSAVDGIANSDTYVMVVHSADDTTVLAENGYDRIYEAHKDNERVRFVLYSDRGHNDLCYTEETWRYREEMDAQYQTYLSDNGLEDNSANEAAFRNEYIDFNQRYALDEELMSQILAMFEEAVK